MSAEGSWYLSHHSNIVNRDHDLELLSVACSEMAEALGLWELLQVQKNLLHLMRKILDSFRTRVGFYCPHFVFDVYGVFDVHFLLVV